MDKKEYKKQWHLANKARMNALCRQRYQNNKQAYIDNSKVWKKNNPDKLRLSNKKYAEKNPKVYTIASWKYQGMVSDDWEVTYNHYVNCDYCEWCDEPFKNSRAKNLDHDHDINNEVNIRGVLCCSCNTGDYLGKFMQTLLN